MRAGSRSRHAAKYSSEICWMSRPDLSTLCGWFIVILLGLLPDVAAAAPRGDAIAQKDAQECELGGCAQVGLAAAGHALELRAVPHQLREHTAGPRREVESDRPRTLAAAVEEAARQVGLDR